MLAIYMRRAADRQRPAQIICHTETAVVNVDDVAAVEQEDDIDADAERASTTSREPLAAADRLMDRAYGRQAVAVQVDQTSREMR